MNGSIRVKSLLLFPLSAIAISLLLTSVFLYNLKADQFLFVHDEFLPITKEESLRSFFTQSPLDFGSANTTPLIVNIFERFFYAALYGLNLNLSTIQAISYFSKLFLLILIPFYGFKKLAKLFDLDISEWVIAVISLWYSFIHREITAITHSEMSRSKSLASFLKP